MLKTIHNHGGIGYSKETGSSARLESDSLMLLVDFSRWCFVNLALIFSNKKMRSGGH